MWRFNPFTQKEQTGLEGRTLDISNLKVHVQNSIAEGGFSCVYFARDVVHATKQYALKHIICSDEESLGLVMKEISVMKLLKGHPNVVPLYAHTILDMGRTKEAFLVMEFCDKCLINVLENRGAGYFEQKQILSIFRDVCNAVFAMHCQCPPIAHRDLKAENLLLGPDGTWKLCDFGSTSTNHKRFERPEEMGIEEDNIRKHTTPAYRAPEMWDLFRREVINEKVDIWALGCLMYRLCYLKSAFDGESKLQILNGNYCIPELPKYSSSMTDLIRDMLQASPDARPDITQVWFRVNEQLPIEMQKSLPDTASSVHLQTAHCDGSIPNSANKDPPMPRRSPAPPSSKEQVQNVSPASLRSKASGSESKKSSGSGNVASFQNGALNTFVAEFDTRGLDSASNSKKSEKEKEFEAEADRLKKQLKQTNIEKAEVTFKYEKLSSICRSQQQEIQELKQALGARTESPNKNAPMNQTPGSWQPATPLGEKIEGTVWELQQGMFINSLPSPDSKPWEAFPEEPKTKPLQKNDPPRLVQTVNGHETKQASTMTSSSQTCGFETESFKAIASNSQISRTPGPGNSSQRFGDSKSVESKPAQPAGWAAF
ncbi:hypothetical protein NE237_010868 [Protea cynaroides]|uniref:non-specific serine/threonine protein kinase n=1 Tax=Protea cynaroides TaxID=273540 RepID=A0A9Q0L0D2_9MAGN|nr:hypothetical protein NE237_010868 [Protea cynaroides]